MTAFNADDLNVIKSFVEPDKVIKYSKYGHHLEKRLSHLREKPFPKACIFPPFQFIESCADDLYINTGVKMSLYRILNTFQTMLGGDMDSRYFLRDISEIMLVAEAIEDVEYLTL